MSISYSQFRVSFSNEVLKRVFCRLLTPEEMFGVGCVFEAEHEDALACSFGRDELIITDIRDVVFLMAPILTSTVLPSLLIHSTVSPPNSFSVARSVPFPRSGVTFLPSRLHRPALI